MFSAVYERSRRLGSALAVALAAPSLNPAALVLTFMLFQPRIAAARLVMALVAVFGIAPLVARLEGSTPIAFIEADDRPRVGHHRGFLGFAASSVHVAVRTVPLILVGVAASMWLAERLPVHLFDSQTARLAAVALASFVVVPIALPTFFEIPLAFTLLSASAPAGVAAMVLFAGPAINLPSLLTIARAAGWKVALVLAIAVGALACVGGLLVG